MGAINDVIKVIKDAILLAKDVELAGNAIKDISTSVHNHELRIIHLEARWQAAMEVSQVMQGHTVSKGAETQPCLPTKS
jgi:hypothetical protein